MESNNELSLAKFILVVFFVMAIPLAFSQLIVRYVYTQWLEPQSTAGTVMMAASAVQQQWNPQKKNILIIGNSRIGEGFSAKLANGVINSNEYNFVVLGLPGTTPRVWFYVLKNLDKDASKFYSVYLMAENYSDTAEENYNDRDIDTAYLAAILTLGDLSTYPASFDDQKKSVDAYRNVLFPIAPLQKDMMQFLKNPSARIKQVLLWRRDYIKWAADYTGRSERLPNVAELTHGASILPQLADWQRPGMEWYFQALPKCNKEYLHSFRYNSRWFGAISEHYSQSAVHLGAFMIPRGPYHNQFGCDSRLKGSLASLHHKGSIDLIPSDVATRLEKPEYFFDHLHINAAGRSQFSEYLAVAIVNQLED